jgi:hypothetical protein
MIDILCQDLKFVEFVGNIELSLGYLIEAMLGASIRKRGRDNRSVYFGIACLHSDNLGSISYYTPNILLL